MSGHIRPRSKTGSTGTKKTYTNVNVERRRGYMSQDEFASGTVDIPAVCWIDGNDIGYLRENETDTLERYCSRTVRVGETVLAVVPDVDSGGRPDSMVAWATVTHNMGGLVTLRLISKFLHSTPIQEVAIPAEDSHAFRCSLPQGYCNKPGLCSAEGYCLTLPEEICPVCPAPMNRHVIDEYFIHCPDPSEGDAR